MENKGKGLRFKDKTGRYYQFGALAVAIFMISGVAIGTLVITEDGSYDTDMNNQYINNIESDYVVWEDAGIYYVIDGETGVISKDDNLADLINGLFTQNNTWVHLKTGVYSQNKTIYMKDYNGLVLSGSGINSTIIILEAGSNCDMIRINNENQGYELFFAKIYNLCIAGNEVGQTSGNGIVLNSNGSNDLADVYIYNVFVNDCKEDGFHIVNGWGLHLYDCLSEFNGGYGVYAISEDQAFISNIFSAYNNKGYFLVRDGWFADNLYSYMNQDDGFVLNTANSVITNCVSKWDNQGDNDAWAFRITDAENTTISNINVISDDSHTLRYGVYFDDASNICVSNINCYGATDSIYVKNDCFDVRFLNILYDDDLIDNGNRTVINGLGVNAGNPNSAGDWNGKGLLGDRVFDTTNDKFYSHNVTGWMVLN